MDGATRMITVTYPNHARLLRDGLFGCLQAKHGLDLEFCWGGQRVTAHRLVLELFISPDKLLVGADIVGEEQSGSDNLGYLLEFLYRGEVSVPEDKLERLLKTAHELDLKMLPGGAEGHRKDVSERDASENELLDIRIAVAERGTTHAEEDVEMSDQDQLEDDGRSCESAQPQEILEVCMADVLVDEVAAAVPEDVEGEGVNQYLGLKYKAKDGSEGQSGAPRGGKGWIWLLRKMQTGLADRVVATTSRDVEDDGAEKKKSDAAQKRKCSTTFRSASADNEDEERIEKKSGWRSKVYRCSNCEFSTVGYKKYQHHLLKVHRLTTRGEPVPLRKCAYPDCDFTAVFPSGLKCHQLKKHSGELPVDNSDIEDSEEEEEEEEEAEEKEKEVLGVVYRCIRCKFATRIQQRYRSHVQMVHKSGASSVARPKLECSFPRCDFTSPYRGDVDYHENTAHRNATEEEGGKPTVSKKRSVKRKQLRSIRIVPEAEMSKAYKCTHCDFQTTRYGMYRSHLQSVHRVTLRGEPIPVTKCNVPGCKYTAAYPSLLTSHRHQVHKDPNRPAKSYTCARCDFSTSQYNLYTSHLLRKHRVTTRGEPAHKLKCDVPGCEYRARYPSHMRGHKLKRHSGCRGAGRKSYLTKCQFCDFTSYWPNGVKRHMNIVHAQGSCRFPCDICGRRCPNKSELVRHRRTHTRERPYRCPWCSYASAVKSTLEKHADAKHGLTLPPGMYVGSQLPPPAPADAPKEPPPTSTPSRPARRLLCPHCGVTFRAESLRSHVLIVHGVGTTAFVCETCGKRCPSQGGLDKHKLSHTKEKPVKCPYCPHGCSGTNDLKGHVDVVHGVGPPRFPCPTCGQRCANRANLLRHMRTHEGDCCHACEQCPRRFSTRSELNKHLVVAHGRPPIWPTRVRDQTKKTKKKRAKRSEDEDEDFRL